MSAGGVIASRGALVALLLAGASACHERPREGGKAGAAGGGHLSLTLSPRTGRGDKEKKEGAVEAPAGASAGGAGPSQGPDQTTETLMEETPDQDPRSQTVTIKLVAEAYRKARVFWGRKDLGLAPLELTRPRGSGPLDLVVLAPGCLPLHTRVFTDRDDRISLRPTPEADAPGLLGYRVEAPTKLPAPPPAPASPAPRRARSP
jgi:hypothetical protein